MASLYDVLKGVVGATRGASKKPVFTPEMDKQIQNPRFDWSVWYAQPPQGFTRDTLPSMDDINARRIELQQMQQQPGLQRARVL